MNFDSVSYDAINRVLTGKPWSELVTANVPPVGYGRAWPCVCLLDGSQVFYCGGCKTSDSIDNVERFDSGTSVITMMLDLQTLMWRQLPDMPEPRYNASVLRVGDCVLVFCGESTDDMLRGSGTRSCLCFDVNQERWLTPDEHGMPDFPGEAYAGIAIGQVSPDDVIFAGGTFESGNDAEIGPRCSHQAFLLHLSSRTWMPLPDLPEGVFEYSQDCSGVVLSRGGSQLQAARFDFAMCGNKESAILHLEEGNSWQILSTIPKWEEESNRAPDGDMAIQFGSLNVVMTLKGGYLYGKSTKSWTRLPAENPSNPYHDSRARQIGFVVDRDGAESFTALLTQSTGVVVQL
eukprot:5975376-Prymnesium_polylepis.1